MISYQILALFIFVVWALTRLMATAKIAFYCQRIMLAGSQCSPISVNIRFTNGGRIGGKIMYQVTLIGIKSSILLEIGDSTITALKKSLKKIENMENSIS